MVFANQSIEEAELYIQMAFVFSILTCKSSCHIFQYGVQLRAGLNSKP